MKQIALIFIFVLFSSFAAADTLELVNGQTLEGTYVDRANGMVRFEVNGVVTAFNEKDVKNISIGGLASPKEPAEGQAAPAKTSTPPAATQPAAGAGAVTVPAGTTIMVRMRDALDSRRHKTGHKFTAVLEADLVANNSIVAPRGSNIYGELSQAKQSRRLVGKSEMSIHFTGLMINNQIRPIKTGEVKAVSDKGSAGNTIGKTARGAIIGGLIDGSDGAKTGAKVGVGAAVLTRGASLNIPPGTLLEVPLAESFSL